MLLILIVKFVVVHGKRYAIKIGRDVRSFLTLLGS